MKKIIKKVVIGYFVILIVCALFSCIFALVKPDKKQQNSDSSTFVDVSEKESELVIAEESEIETATDEIQESKLTKDDLDIDNIIKETRDDLDNLLSQDFGESKYVRQYSDYVLDYYIGVDSAGRLNITAVVKDDTSQNDAYDFADTLVRRLSSNACYLYPELKNPENLYYGELYDIYDALVGVAPQSQTENTDKWYLFDAITDGKDMLKEK